MTPGDVARCVDVAIPGRPTFFTDLGLITRGREYMVLDLSPADPRVNLGEPSVRVRADNGGEFWSLARRFVVESG